jgi:hypothetical protein
LLRRDPVTGRWVRLPVAIVCGEWQGSYSLRVPPWPARQRLLVVPGSPLAAPPTGAGRLRVSVIRGRVLLGEQAGPPARLDFMNGLWWSPDVAVVRRGGSREFSYHLTNDTAVANG